jgi:hypothetical protein
MVGVKPPETLTFKSPLHGLSVAAGVVLPVWVVVAERTNLRCAV